MTAPPAGALEACPFCGCEAVAENYVIEAQVVCRGCGARIARSHGARDDNGLPEAIAAWNRRTHGPALLAALRLREWRPIAEAPKDGRSVLIFCKDAVIPAIAFFCEDAGSWMSIAGESFAHPIMWVPAPIPTADDLARVLEEGE